MQILIAVLLTAAAPTALPRGTCAIENASYRLVGEDHGAQLRFVDDPKLARQSALSAVLKLNDVKAPLKFTFAASNGYSTQYLVPVVDKGPDDEDGEGLGFYMFNAGLEPVDLPSPGETAPDYVFVPDLGKTLWYGSMNGGQRIHLETGMWRRAECGR
jgi:hypothetical protein